ncbi:hypothetical protein ABZP36_027990 [Zizania latifolia]
MRRLIPAPSTSLTPRCCSPPTRPRSSAWSPRFSWRAGGQTLATFGSRRGCAVVAAWRRRRSEERGLCSADAARRGDETKEEDQRIAGGGVSRPVLGRRQRSLGNAALGSGVLLAVPVPGVGPRNLRKLVDKGFNGVAQLEVCA